MNRYVESAKAGSGPASRVRVTAGRYSGLLGVVVRVVPVSGTVLVRLPGGATLPFGDCELELVRR